MSNNSSREKTIKIFYITSACIMLLLIAASFLLCKFGEMHLLSTDYVRDVSVDVTCLVVCGILIFSIMLDKPWDEHNRSLFRLIFTLGLLFFNNQLCCFWEYHDNRDVSILLTYTFLYYIETLLLYSFYAYVRTELKINKKSIPLIDYIAKGALIADLIADILNVKFGYFFTIGSNHDYVKGTFENCSEISAFIIYTLIWYLIIIAKDKPWKEKGILISFQIFPVIAHLSGIATDNYSAVFPAYMFSVMLIYINVFAARSKKVLEQKVELDEQRAALMVSQIQPHFLYNVLTTISNLCVTDPEEAEETTVLFSQYLRTNLDSIRETAPVPFRKELGHINTYVTLEKKRFKDKIQYEVDCEAQDFLVPSLGLQPIVENSIKHGIRGKETQGHLKITSKAVEGGYEVVIEDDGVGFDMNAPLPDDGRSHVGMHNVKSRLEQICNANVTVVSSPGNGCKTTIFFPET